MARSSRRKAEAAPEEAEEAEDLTASAQADADAQAATEDAPTGLEATGETQQPGGNTEDGTGDAGQAEVQAEFDEAEEQGFFGEGKEDKDRDALTVEGQAGATDENDDDRAAANKGAAPGEGEAEA